MTPSKGALRRSFFAGHRPRGSDLRGPGAIRRCAESFCALACATRASACASPAIRRLVGRSWLSYSDFAINASLIQTLGASPVQIPTRSASDFARFKSAAEVFNAASAASRIGLRRFQRSLHGVHIGLWLHVFQLRQHLALLDLSPSFTYKLGDLCRRRWRRCSHRSWDSLSPEALTIAVKSSPLHFPGLHVTTFLWLW